MTPAKVNGIDLNELRLLQLLHRLDMTILLLKAEIKRKPNDAKARQRLSDFMERYAVLEALAARNVGLLEQTPVPIFVSTKLGAAGRPEDEWVNHLLAMVDDREERFRWVFGKAPGGEAFGPEILRKISTSGCFLSIVTLDWVNQAGPAARALPSPYIGEEVGAACALAKPFLVAYEESQRPIAGERTIPPAHIGALYGNQPQRIAFYKTHAGQQQLAEELADALATVSERQAGMLQKLRNATLSSR